MVKIKHKIVKKERYLFPALVTLTVAIINTGVWFIVNLLNWGNKVAWVYSAILYNFILIWVVTSNNIQIFQPIEVEVVEHEVE